LYKSGSGRRVYYGGGSYIVDKAYKDCRHEQQSIKLEHLKSHERAIEEEVRQALRTLKRLLRFNPSKPNSLGWLHTCYIFVVYIRLTDNQLLGGELFRENRIGAVCLE